MGEPNEPTQEIVIESTLDVGPTVPWWHFLHEWTRWRRGEADLANFMGATYGKRRVQTRYCMRCNLEQVRDYRLTP